MMAGIVIIVILLLVVALFLLLRYDKYAAREPIHGELREPLLVAVKRGIREDAARAIHYLWRYKP